MSEVTNAEIYGVLLDLKEDVGGLKKSCDLQLEAIKSHSIRLTALEGAAERQRGAAKVWGLVATCVATVAAAAIELLRPHH